MDLKKHAQEITRTLATMYPGAKCALRHDNPFQLLIATILSAQCTDARVNEVTKTLFKKYPGPGAFTEADLEEIEEAIRTTGFFRNKAKNIQACCRRLTSDFSGQVPGTMEQLVTLAGVGRKTANVILGNCFGVPGIVVDTHVQRLAGRMGLSKQKDPERIESELAGLIPPKDQVAFSHQMILHGRTLCQARKPLCSRCPLERICPQVGVSQS